MLRSVRDEPRPPGAPARVWRDWVLVGGLVLLTALEAVLRPEQRVALVVVAALIPTMLWRRSRPLLMVAIAFGVTSVLPVFTGGVYPQAYAMAYLLLLPYALFRWGSGREAVLGLAIMLVKVVLSEIFGHLSLADAIGGFVVLFAVVALGTAVRFRARAKQRELDQVKLLERERLARDLHDVVAHHVSAMAIRAQAGLATMAVNPDAAADALRVIEAEASQALAEMRAMVRVLRRDEPLDLAPNPTVADLPRLADRARTGPAVDVEILGDVEDLPPSIGTAIYRLAQESVTNARRHARHATRIEVRVAADDRSVHLRVSDDGDLNALRPAPVPGYGLIGMIERAGLLGGTCQAGPNPDRGWTVTATLPKTGVAA